MSDPPVTLSGMAGIRDCPSWCVHHSAARCRSEALVVARCGIELLGLQWERWGHGAGLGVLPPPEHVGPLLVPEWALRDLLTSVGWPAGPDVATASRAGKARLAGRR